MNEINLSNLICAKIESLGATDAGAYFGVSSRTVRNWAEGKNSPPAHAAQLVLDEYMKLAPCAADDSKGKVQILLPVYRTLNGKTHFTLFANYRNYGPDRLSIIPCFNTLIVEARSILAEQALKTESEWFLFIDDDMILPFGNAAGLKWLGANIPDPNAAHAAIARIMSHSAEYKILSGLYYSKNSKHNGINSNCVNSEIETAKYQKHFLLGGDMGVVETAWTGFGFTRVHRSVFENMIENIATLPEIKPYSNGRHHGFFNQYGPDYSEDASFCLRAKKLGIKSYIDTGLIVGHSGEYIY